MYFACTEGGPQNLGQVWVYDPGREVVTLLYQGATAADLRNPDNVVVNPKTGDVFLCEDGPGQQFVRAGANNKNFGKGPGV